VNESDSASLRYSRRDAIATVWTIVCLPLFLLILSFVMDVGWMSAARGHLQLAADFGALAGVQELDYDALASGICILNQVQAENVARQFAMDNLSRNLSDSQLRACTVVIRVANPGHPETPDGYPRVIVNITLPAQTPITGIVRTIIAHAEASILPRR
jgi:hypothetical protein